MRFMNGAKQHANDYRIHDCQKYLLWRRNPLSKLAFGRRMNRRHRQHFLRRSMICLNRTGVIISASIAFSVVVEAGTNFYVDPDWTGAKSGTQSRPFAILDKSAWHRINAALASSDVTIYFSARRAASASPTTASSCARSRRCAAPTAFSSGSSA